MNWYTEVLKKYWVFEGRAHRTEYWMFALINTIISIVLTAIDVAVLGDSETQVISSLYSLAVLIPSIAVGVRRLHDTGRSGAWWFIVLLPVIGIIVLLVFFVLDSDPGDNEYGPSPK